jgi:4-diphosphocytidyl-2-C-methyl-D-erythritol kinase
MIVFPNCKINFGLHILNRREDGFHNLATVFYPLPLTDVLEIIRNNDEDNSEQIRFSITGNTVDGKMEDNLCVKAYHLLKKDFPDLPHIKMHLHKAIPMGAGLGGGSADASFTLRLMNDKFQLGLSTEQLINYALELGSDCPFFILNQPCYATGRGEILEPVQLSLSGYQLLLINPGIHINTGWAFSALNISPSVISYSSTEDAKNLRAIVCQNPATWSGQLINDFEKPVFVKYPELSKIKEELYQLGALYAAMSGSGSSIFGLFEKNAAPVASFPQHYFVKLLRL